MLTFLSQLSVKRALICNNSMSVRFTAYPIADSGTLALVRGLIFAPLPLENEIQNDIQYARRARRERPQKSVTASTGAAAIASATPALKRRDQQVAGEPTEKSVNLGKIFIAVSI
jgi:hypothetical protein